MQNLKKTIKNSSLQIIGTEKEEEVQTKGIKTYLIMTKMVIQVQEAFRTQDQKSTSACPIIVKTLSIWNKERTLKAAREEHQDTT
jgi:hypothetical protein